MNENDLVSIIVIVSDEGTIDKCLESIFKQTYKNYEVIIGDNGKQNDKIFDFADRITYLKVDSCNNSMLKNKAINLAKGKYLCFVTGNDVLKPDYLKQLVDHINDHDLAIGNYTTISSFKSNNKEIVYFKEDINKQYFELLKIDRLYNLNSKLYKREYIKKYNLFFNENNKSQNDLLFNISYLIYCNSINLFEQKICLINHRQLKDYQIDMFETEKDSLLVLKRKANENNYSLNLINYLYIRLGFEELIQDIAFNQEFPVVLNDKVYYIINKKEVLEALDNYTISCFKANVYMLVIKARNVYLVKGFAYCLYLIKYHKLNELIGNLKERAFALKKLVVKDNT